MRQFLSVCQFIRQEVLRSHEVVFWFDSSVRIGAGEWINSTLRLADENGGIVLFSYTGHTIYPATHAGLYDYLPIDKETAIRTDMLEAGLNMIYRNPQVTSFLNARVCGRCLISDLGLHLSHVESVRSVAYPPLQNKKLCSTTWFVCL